MQIVFCDDDTSEREVLLGYAERYADKHKLSIEPRLYGSAEDLLKDPNADAMPAMFLDIYMGGITGQCNRFLPLRSYWAAGRFCAVTAVILSIWTTLSALRGTDF